MENLETIIKKAGTDNGFTFTLATPSEENMAADDLSKKILWLDIQQDGQFNIENLGYRLAANLKLHFMDDMEWDEEGETANARKNEILSLAFLSFRQILNGLNAAGEWEIKTSPTWQVLYNVNDRNKIDIMLNVSVVQTKITYC